MTKKNIYVDIDGTLCSITDSNYQIAKPFFDAIDKVNKLYDQGHNIIIYTARYMGRTGNNEKEAYKLGYELTLSQLKSWDLKFHKLKMGKPSYDILIDDKSYNYDSNWIKKL